MREEKPDVKKYIDKWKGLSNSSWDKENAADLLPAEMEGKPASEFYNEIQKLGYKGPRTKLAYGVRFYDMHLQGMRIPEPEKFQGEERLKDPLLLFILKTEDAYHSLLEEADKDMRIRVNKKMSLLEDYKNPHLGAYERFDELIGDMRSFFSFLLQNNDIHRHPIFNEGYNLDVYRRMVQEGYVKLRELTLRGVVNATVEHNIALVVNEWFNMSPEKKEDIPLNFLSDRLPRYYEKEAKEIMKELGWKGGYNSLDLIHLGISKR